MDSPEHFDAVVVGSGFGGSVMAYRLAEAGMRVCLLERGKRYPPGSFARSPREMRDNFWDPGRGKHGLFQVWSFEGIDSIVSSGLGGGSLIYANVLIRKDENWFVRRRPDGGYDPWPVTRAELDPHYARVEQMLAAQPYPFDKPPYRDTPKTRAFKEAAERAGLHWSLPNLAITFGSPADNPIPGEPIRDAHGRTTDNLHHRARSTCRLCGECNIGCNYGSKNTLDYNYLSEANKLGAELRDGCEVRTLAPRTGGRGFAVEYVEHDVDDSRSGADQRPLPRVEITSDRLILAAGTFGTTYLLLKNRDHFPRLSRHLGHHFSGNGDMLGVAHNAHATTGDQVSTLDLSPSHGSVITSTVRVADASDTGEGRGDGPGYYIQDGGYPGFVDWMVESTASVELAKRAIRFVESRTMHRIARHTDAELDTAIEALIGSARRSSSLLPLLGMGLDRPGGVITLDAGGTNLEVKTSPDDSIELANRIIKTMGAIASELGAEFEVNPLWHLHHRLVTVHPVGGCSMGHDREDGVVDSYGEAFGYPGLVIADGSVMPGPVGPNPSLTIAALSDRFADHQLATTWPGPPAEA
jgi:cholesterol oxidase